MSLNGLSWNPYLPAFAMPPAPQVLTYPMMRTTYPSDASSLAGGPSILQAYYPVSWVASAAPAPLRPVALMPPVQSPWQNRLKQMFHQRESVIYALNLRTFAAQDKNADGVIDPRLGENGNFLRAIPRLQELKNLGVNTLHLLPINPVGKLERLGEFGSPGSIYAPAAYDKLNPEYDEPNNGLSVIEEARLFVEAAHRLGIHVMVDVPSCASADLALERPDLLARDIHGKMLTPTNWVDIKMFVKDSPALRAYYQKFFDVMVHQVGVDGFRVDVARARTMSFWRHFIAQYPQKGWLAETYTEEDVSPMKNIPRDVPEDLLKAGFDTMYGQFHIFHEMNATQYLQYLLQNQAMFQRVGPEKSAIGSFLTHDDPSTMEHGGALYCKLISGLMTTQPDTNPYILDGFTTGDPNQLNIFDWKPRPQGQSPDIGQFLQQMLAIRKDPKYSKILRLGQFIPLEVHQDPKNPQIIAFLRQYQGRTLLVVANKDMNATQAGTLKIPGLLPQQKLNNMAPAYGEPSTFDVESNQLNVKLAHGRFYLFELDLPQKAPQYTA